jgi:hypothetical protein
MRCRTSGPYRANQGLPLDPFSYPEPRLVSFHQQLGIEAHHREAWGEIDTLPA